MKEAFKTAATVNYARCRDNDYSWLPFVVSVFEDVPVVVHIPSLCCVRGCWFEGSWAGNVRSCNVCFVEGLPNSGFLSDPTYFAY